MKIGLVTPYEYPFPGGVTEHVYYLDHWFREWGHQVKIIAPTAGDAENVPDNVIRISSSITSIPFSGSVSRVTLSPKIYLPVKRLLRKERFDVLHIHEPLTPALSLFVLRHSKTVCVGTAAQLQPIERFSDGRPNILFVGRLEQRKGFRFLMRAYPYVLEAVPDARLIVAGAYDKEDKEPFVRYARMHGLTGAKFVGRISQEDLPRYYRTCDVFCAPSTGFESFGIVLLEAMAAGKPIVATDIPGYRSVVEDVSEGLMVEPENERALAKAIIHLLRNPGLRREMGERGRRKAANYDWPIVAQQILDLYTQLVRLKSRVGANAQ